MTFWKIKKIPLLTVKIFNLGWGGLCCPAVFRRRAWTLFPPGKVCLGGIRSMLQTNSNHMTPAGGSWASFHMPVLFWCSVADYSRVMGDAEEGSSGVSSAWTSTSMGVLRGRSLGQTDLEKQSLWTGCSPSIRSQLGLQRHRRYDEGTPERTRTAFAASYATTGRRTPRYDSAKLRLRVEEYVNPPM